jgi:glycosyltransferase involved in cell wall biosynthesis
MDEPLVTFIIPSLAGGGLPNAIKSLHAQTDPRWRAIVGFDHRDPTIKPDHKISVFKHTGHSKKSDDCIYCIEGLKSGAGPVRNSCVAKATTEWVAFLDDDDIVTPDYVEKLALESQEVDAVSFRMLMWHWQWLPPATARVDNFTHGSVGISFACRRNVFDKCQFTRGRGEDFRMLRDIRDAGFRIKISPYLTYLVRHCEVSQKVLHIKSNVEKELLDRSGK